MQTTSRSVKALQPESGTGWPLPETTDHSIYRTGRESGGRKDRGEAPVREREVPVGKKGSCGLQPVVWGPVAGMWNGVLVFCAQNGEVSREAQRTMESADNGLLHLRTQAHAHKSQCGSPSLQPDTHKSVPTRLASFTVLSDIHNSHYEDYNSWYVIISFDIWITHIFAVHTSCQALF